MFKDIKTHPFYSALLRDTKRRVANAERETNRRDARPNAQVELFEARAELKNLLAQLRTDGFDV